MNDRHQIISDKEFWAALEWAVSPLLGRRFWTDGFVPECVTDTQRGVDVEGAAWICEGSRVQHSYRFVASIPQKMLHRRRKTLFIGQVELDETRRILRIEIASAKRDTKRPVITTMEHLKWALQALALSAAEQKSIFPPLVCAADELALNFESWLRVAAREDKCTQQSALLATLDRALARMSGSEHLECLTDAALETDSRWEEIRQLAANALQSFDWLAELPPFGLGDVYVGPPRT